MTDERPTPNLVDDAATLRRWYWLRSELVDIARRRGVPTGGGKLALTDRLGAHFDGRILDEHPPPRRSRDALPAHLDATVVLHERQACTQRLRAWMRAEVGAAFVFDAPMRDAVVEGGLTLGDLVTRWHATRSRTATDIPAQFELNRFARRWHEQHPHGTHAQMLTEWAHHRSRPRGDPAPPLHEHG